MSGNFLVDSVIAGGWPSIAIGSLLILMSIASAASMVMELLRMGRSFWNIDRIGEQSSDIWLEIEKHISLHPGHGEMVKRHDETFFDHIDERGRGPTTILASVGANAPYVGLLGTVAGVYGALEKIGQGAISMAQIAPPVGEALAMTAVGLLVAIPAVMGYNLVSRMRLKLGRMTRNHGRNIRTHGVHHKTFDREMMDAIRIVNKIKRKNG